MIRIKSISLTDFGRHKSVHADFDGCVVGLTGSNGLGKSTVLQALQFAYTGTIETEPAEPLANFIRRSSGDDPPKFAEVESTFDADGRQGRIIRRITRTSITRKLYWDGAEKPITSDKEVTEILTRVLGVDKKAINSTVFIRQGEMASMFGQETDRRDFYTRLLMLAHLAKVANVVETHRAHLASTVQDLGAVRDAAASAYEEAATYFETADEALKGSPSQAENLALARKVLASFEDRDTVELAVERAKITLSNRAGADSTTWLTEVRARLDEANAMSESLTFRKSDHIQATNAAAAAEKKVAELKRVSQLFADVDTVQAQLLAVGNAGSAGEDPGPKIKSLEVALTNLERRDALTESLPARRAAAEAADAECVVLAAAVDDKQKVYEANRETYAALKSVLDMRKGLLATCQAGGYDRHDGCPLCGSEAEPDAERLQRDIDDDESVLAKAVALGKASAEALREAETLYERKAATATRDRSQLDEDEQELKRLKVELALTDRAEAQVELALLQEEQKAYSARAFECARLGRELDTRKRLVEGALRPQPADVSSAKLEHQAAQIRLELASWSTDDEAMEIEAGKVTKDCREAISAVQSYVADLLGAEQRAAEASAALQAAIDAVPKGFYADVLTGAAVLTAKEAAEKLSALDQQQQDHDSARGRREAANDNLKAASRKVDELDLRTAEQRHRLDLVKDLEILRDTFKPSGASLEYLNYKFGQIAVMAADYLAESGADFMVAASEEIPLSFEFLRTDRENEVWMPQNRLSGGQKVRLAVATLRAIHALVMPNVGLLVLDEPTTHLDDEAKRSMADMLRTIGDEGTLQMIVCDHSPILVDAFSDIIQLPES